MEYPAKMEPFRGEIAALSSYLVTMRSRNRLGKIEPERISPVFQEIADGLYPGCDKGNFLSDNVAEAFVLNMGLLHMEIGDAIHVENEAMIATMVLTTFTKITEFMQDCG